jgi:hypothetical protein
MKAPVCKLCRETHWGMCDGRSRVERNVTRVRELVPTVDVTKPVTKPRTNVTKPPPTKSKGGRPVVGDRAMTAAERKRRSRAKAS